jgi:CheY-like chemotaxis protein
MKARWNVFFDYWMISIWAASLPFLDPLAQTSWAGGERAILVRTVLDNNVNTPISDSQSRRAKGNSVLPGAGLFVGYSNSRAASAKEQQARIRCESGRFKENPQSSPDLVILDLNMPGGGGFSAANRIRNAGLTPKILIYTTHTFPGLERIARAADCDGFVVKANATQDLIRGIRAVLRGEEFYSSFNSKAQTA